MSKLEFKKLLTSICSAPSLSICGPGIHLIIDSKSGPRSSAKFSGDSPAFPLIPLAYITWKSHCKKMKIIWRLDYIILISDENEVFVKLQKLTEKMK